jgi:hypothetical protein
MTTPIPSTNHPDVITLAGVLEFTTAVGETCTIHRGDVLVAELISYQIPHEADLWIRIEMIAIGTTTP